MQPRPDQITLLTFDCYGTLIDWETGILNALASLLQARGRAPRSEELLRAYVHHEARLEAKAWAPYRQLLKEIAAAIAQDFGVALSESEQNRLPDSLASWPPFPDTVRALRRLKQRFRLAILSNIDDALFAQTARVLEVPFDAVITAEQVKSYKPGHAHFHEALRQFRVQPSQVLHVAQSLYHDHVPARSLGFFTAHVTRPSRLPATGLAPQAAVLPDLVVADLAELADRLS